jgi:hypothetical protein
MPPVKGFNKQRKCNRGSFDSSRKSNIDQSSAAVAADDIEVDLSYGNLAVTSPRKRQPLRL